MAKVERSPERREDALSRERIVGAAIELLDAAGEPGLTFRALATRLATGAGALYWHIANKQELLIAATDAIVVRALAEVHVTASPQRAIRRIALGVFDAIDQHPWLGAQLSRAPWEASTLQIFEQIGRQVQALGARRGAELTAATALVSYIIGVSVQNSAQGRKVEPGTERSAYLEAEAERWHALDARAYPFTRSVATKLAKHDDRLEYLAGIGFFLAGISAPRRAARTRVRQSRHRG